jgi:hypothetical protein
VSAPPPPKNKFPHGGPSKSSAGQRTCCVSLVDHSCICCTLLKRGSNRNVTSSAVEVRPAHRRQSPCSFSTTMVRSSKGDM